MTTTMTTSTSKMEACAIQHLLCWRMAALAGLLGASGWVAGQSRIAFRSPSANAKGESAPGGYTSNFGSNASPAKDGDVVVSFSESLAGGTDFFTIAEPQAKQRPGLSGPLMGISGGSGADAQFVFTASISDPVVYQAEVVGMVKAAQREMLSGLKP